MKHIPLISALILSLALASGLHAQTSSILIKTGDTINGTSSNSATLRSLGSVAMNDLGGIAFQGLATETNRVTNSVTITNFGWTTNFVPSTNRIVTRIVTNVINTTNTYTFGGTNYTFTNTVPQYGFQTNFVVTNRPVLTPSRIVSVTNRVTVSNLNYSGIWSSDSNNVSSLLIRSGQPSGITNSTITSLFNPVINNNGAVAFVGNSIVTNSVLRTNGTNANVLSNVASVYLAIPGSTNPIRVASVGAPAPGLSDNFTAFGTIVLPDVGGVIFQAWAGTNHGIWAQNPDTSLHLIARRGQTIAVGGTNKVINGFNIQGRFHSQDTGAITYQAWFTDGTSAAVRVNR